MCQVFQVPIWTSPPIYTSFPNHCFFIFSWNSIFQLYKILLYFVTLSIRILLTVEEIMEVEMSLADSLMKVLMFVIVQALVYLILSSSSDSFSKNKMRSLSFKPARSLSIRRIMASISDLPQGVEPSPSSRSSKSQTQENPEEYETY